MTPRPRATPDAQHAGGAGASTRWPARRWGLLLVLAGNMLIDALEVSAMIVALPAVGDGLHLGPGTLAWLVGGFAAGFAGLLLLGGRLVAALGRRPVYLTALLVFAAASVAGGLADGPLPLLVTRVVKGACAALTAPTGLAIITTAFPDGPERRRAVSVYTLVGGSGFALGLVVSGLLTSIDWRWTFLFPAPVVLALFALALPLIPREPAPAPGQPPVPATAAARLRGIAPAVAAAGCLTGALLALLYAITAARPAIGALALAAVALAALAVIERTATRRTAIDGTKQTAIHRTAAAPLLRPALLRHPALVRSMLGAAALNGANLGLLLLTTLRLQDALGWSPLRTGLALLPASVPLAATALLSGRLIARFGTARLIAAAALCPIAGCLLYLAAAPPTHYLTGMLPALLLLGAGFVLGFAALNAQALAGLPDQHRATAGATYQTAVQTAAAVTPVAVTALLSIGFRPAVWLVTAIAALGLPATRTGRGARSRRPAAEAGPRPRRAVPVRPGEPGGAAPYRSTRTTTDRDRP